MNWLESFVTRLADLGPWAPVIFVVVYTGATLALAPAFLLTVAAGAVFGLWRGSALVFVSAALGSSAVYAFASPLARSRLMKWVVRDPRLTAVREAVVDDGVRIMFLLRLSPVVPLVFLNYALALSGVSFRNYLIALVGMVPAIVMYAYYGKVVGDVAVLAAGGRPRGPAYYVLLFVGLAATVVASTLIARAAKRRIAEMKAQP